MDPWLESCAPPRRIMMEFIEIFKSEPCLWKVTSPDYYNRVKKDKAYSRLLEKLRTIEPEADKKTVAKKLHNLKTAVRKQRKKYENLLKSKKSARYVEPPTLWYYNKLSFLADKEASTRLSTNMDMEDNTPSENPNPKTLPAAVSMKNTCDPVDTDNPGPMSSTQKSSGNTCKSTRSTDTTSFKIKDPTPASEQNETDEGKLEAALQNKIPVSKNVKLERSSYKKIRCDMFGKLVAAKLKRLENRQRMVVEKLINDVLVEAEKGNTNLKDLNISDLVSSQDTVKLCKQDDSLK